MIVLGIETSCDETSCAVLNNGKLAANVVSSQIDIHKEYGGVVPELASRNHIKNIDFVLNETLTESNIKINQINLIAVTVTPGLIGSLFVGVCYAKSLAYALNISTVPVHHIDAHIQSIYLENSELEYPYLAMVLSGGHSLIILCRNTGDYEILGTTIDDAVGEAYDKVARLLGLEYPGGPIVDKLADDGNNKAIDFPRVYLKNNSLNFSMSGLKTAVYYYLKENENNININDVCASFQSAIGDVLVRRVQQAMKITGVKKLVLAGGVAANRYIRKILTESIKKAEGEFFVPSLNYCTDNAAMIAMAGYRNYKAGVTKPADIYLTPSPYTNLPDFF